MSLFLALKLVVALCFLFLVPGLPIAVYFSRAIKRPWACLAMSPFFSITAIFSSLYVLNSSGIRPNLALYGSVLAFLTAVATFKQFRYDKKNILVIVSPLLSAFPATILSLFTWVQSYSQFNFAAPNQDAYNHTFWISRIAQVNSVLAADSQVDSPLQLLGSGGGFYPFAWHSAVAVAGSITQIPSPILSLASIFILWGLALPLGLHALAKEWSPQAKYLGLTAGILVQVYPLVPGVPMSWGSMTSCAGIALLPVSFLIVIAALKERKLLSTMTAMGVFLAMIFIHTPEAATLGVLTVCALPFFLSNIRASILLKLAGIGIVCISPVFYIFRSFIFDDDYPITWLFGAVNPSWENAIGTFMTMGVNVPIGPSILSFLFVIGLVMAAYRKYSLWLFAGLFGVFFVYLTSGAPSGILTSLRIYTAPWYASYERTAWVAVPFFALVSAVPIAALADTFSSKKFGLKAMGAMLAIVLLFTVVRQQYQPTITQLQKGPTLSEVVGKKDGPVLQRLKKRLKKDEIVFTFANDGSSYAFMYEGIPTTKGTSYNRFGQSSELIAALNRDIRSICASPEARRAITEEKIGAFVFGDRLLGWGPPGWQPADIRALPGLQVVDSGEHLTVAVPLLGSCW
jgi:hypothetical protein